MTGESDWRAVQNFVQRYGGDLFHARFMTLANLRGILHRGVGAYLDYLRDNPDPLQPIRLLDDLDNGIRREDAIRRLEIVLQAVVENYEEYKDYNTTTTQSDYGENLHVLLEFLRLKVAYERHAWQFRPLVLAHEVLARRGRTQTAILWEQSLSRVTRDLARRHLEQLARLERMRGMRLSTIRDRLNERFVKPLALDRLCALIEPSMHEASGVASAREEAGERPASLGCGANCRRSRRRRWASVWTCRTGCGGWRWRYIACRRPGRRSRCWPRTSSAYRAGRCRGRNCSGSSAIGIGLHYRHNRAGANAVGRFHCRHNLGKDSEFCYCRKKSPQTCIR